MPAVAPGLGEVGLQERRSSHSWQQPTRTTLHVAARLEHAGAPGRTPVQPLLESRNAYVVGSIPTAAQTETPRTVGGSV